MWDRALRLLGATACAAFAVFGFTPLADLARDRLRAAPQLEPADAIVVLGAAVDREGVLNANSLRRAVHGTLLYRRGLAPVVVFMGAAYGGPPEAQVRAELARRLGLPADAVLAESRAMTTREEAQRARELMAARGGRRVLLVTGELHMGRAAAAFRRAGLAPLAAPVAELSAAHRPEDRLAVMEAVARESLARLYYRIAGYS
jgi:uncharacterized SAM-binding protein YcdF (DUF218 family)